MNSKSKPQNKALSGFTQIPNHILRNTGITKNEKLVLIVLSSYNPKFPSRADIAKMTDLSRDTVRLTLNKLKADGIVSWKQGNSYGNNNEYRIHEFQYWGRLTTSLGGADSKPRTGLTTIPPIISICTKEDEPNLDMELYASLTDAEFETLKEESHKAFDFLINLPEDNRPYVVSVDEARLLKTWKKSRYQSDYE